MSEYQETVRRSLSQLENEELLARINEGGLTEEAARIARSILQERGHSFNPDRNVHTNSPSTKSSEVTTTDKKFNDSLIFIWLVTLFAFGMSQHVSGSFSKAAAEVAAQKFVMGLFYLIIGGVIATFWIKKKNKQYTHDQLMARYKTRWKTLVIVLGLFVVFSGFRLFSGVYSGGLFFDLAITLGIGIALYLRQSWSYFAAALYGLINSVALGFMGAGGAGGMLWTFVFYSAACAVLERKHIGLLEAGGINREE